MIPPYHLNLQNRGGPAAARPVVFPHNRRRQRGCRPGPEKNLAVFGFESYPLFNKVIIKTEKRRQSSLLELPPSGNNCGSQREIRMENFALGLLIQLTINNMHIYYGLERS
jgi:hypothetical protein